MTTPTAEQINRDELRKTADLYHCAYLAYRDLETGEVPLTEENVRAAKSKAYEALSDAQQHEWKILARDSGNAT